MLGPLDFFVVEFPGGKVDSAGFAQLLSQVDRGAVRLLDLEFVRREDDGALSSLAAHDVSTGDGFDFGQFDGANAGLLDDTDLSEVAGAIASGSIAAIGIYEVLGILPAFAAWEAAGASIIGDGPVLEEDLVAALDAAEE